MTDAAVIVTVTVQLAVGIGLLALARWSRRNATRLVPQVFAEDERHHRTRVLVRGSWACQIVGVFFLLSIVPVFLT